MTTKERLENLLIDKGLAVDLLWGVKGQWRKTIMDVMRWEAHCRRADGMFVHVGSWWTMTECVRRGFDLVEDGHFHFLAECRDNPDLLKRPGKAKAGK